jgi:hypothetical protein
MSQSPTGYGSIGPGKSKKDEIKKRRMSRSDFCGEADDKNFSFVNESPRRLWSRRAGIEGVAHCGRLR